MQKWELRSMLDGECLLSNSAADLEAVREIEGKWTRWFSNPLYGRGYPADVVADFEKLGALPKRT